MPTSRQSKAEDATQELLNNMLRNFDDGERLRNLPLFLRQKDLAHILFLAEIYRKIVEVPGYIAEFGVMWGRNLNLFHCLRECYEPYNHTRRLIGFDTFSGFVGTTEEDQGSGEADLYQSGAYSVPEGHLGDLTALLRTQEATSHLSHIERFELVQGDVIETVPNYLSQNPHVFLALCYFDLDLYKPTKAVLEAIKGRLVKGSVLVFDELLNGDHPGETAAVDEIFGLENMKLRRSALSGWKTYLVMP